MTIFEKKNNEFCHLKVVNFENNLITIYRDYTAEDDKNKINTLTTENVNL